MASGIAAGAQAGAAFGPWGAAIGGALGGITDLAGGGGGGPFMGGSGSAASHGNTLDGAGWVVNTGSGTQVASASPTRTTIDPTAAAYGVTGGAAAPMQAGLGSLAMVAIAAVALGLIMRKRKA
jgi:hypothetical protein